MDISSYRTWIVWEYYVVDGCSFSYSIILYVHEGMEGLVIVNTDKVVKAVRDNTKASEVSG